MIPRAFTLPGRPTSSMSDISNQLRMLQHPRPQWSDLAKEIIAGTAAIISEHGFAAATLRAVAKKANVQLPQIYHHVGNMAQLLDAVGVYCWDKHVEAQSTTDSPVNDLHDAVETLIMFGLDHPEVYLHNTMPREDRVSYLWGMQANYLKDRLKRVAKVGRLRLAEDQAAEFIHPFCAGMIFTCLHQTSHSTNIHWIGLQVLRHVLIPEQPDQPNVDSTQKASVFALGLKASLEEVTVLTQGERALLRELLQRIARP